MRISSISAREILDSRGNPTVEVVVAVNSGSTGVASVPSGASTGTHEALELRDGDPKRYGGLGELKVVKNVVGEIASALHGLDCTDQTAIDARLCELDGTTNKSRLGANAILGVSMAVARVAANATRTPLYRHLSDLYHSHGGSKKMSLPVPMMNLLNGGRHANFALDIQECLILPTMPMFAERVRAGSEIFHALGAILKKRGLSTGVGDEGGYAPSLESNVAAFELLVEAITQAGYQPGKNVFIGADVAASEFYDPATRTYNFAKDQKQLDAAATIAMYQDWLAKFPFATLEDGLSEDDWSNWELLTSQLGAQLKLVGDDLFVTNSARLRRGIEEGVANAILIKLNQIGTVTETLGAIRLAQTNDYAVAVSHRSGETADTFIADLAVGVGSDYIKTGSLSRSERVEKYNRLMAIEAELQS